MSYNNFTDADAAWRAAFDHQQTCVAIIKHANPCGIAISSVSVADAHRSAHECDPLSAFGGVIAANSEVTVEMAERVSEIFTEVIIAPAYEEGAVAILARKKNIRVLVAAEPAIDGVEIVVVAAQAAADIRAHIGMVVHHQHGGDIGPPAGDAAGPAVASSSAPTRTSSASRASVSGSRVPTRRDPLHPASMGSRTVKVLPSPSTEGLAVCRRAASPCRARAPAPDRYRAACASRNLRHGRNARTHAAGPRRECPARRRGKILYHAFSSPPFQCDLSMVSVLSTSSAVPEYSRSSSSSGRFTSACIMATVSLSNNKAKVAVVICTPSQVCMTAS